MSRTKKPLILLAFLAFLGVQQAACTHHHRIVILPFENLSAHSEDQWIRDGFSESLADHLDYLPDVHVITRADLNQACKELKISPYIPFEEDALASRVGKKLDATEVIIGSFRRRQDYLVAFSRMVEVDSGKVIQAYRQKAEALQNYLFFSQVREIAHGFMPAFGISESDTAAVQEQMSPADKRTSKLKAFEYFILGRLASFKGTEEDYRVATTWYDEAIKTDYHYALAYVGRAEALTLWGFLVKQSNRPYQEFYRKAHEALARARTYDPNISAFHRRRFQAMLDADIDYIVGETHLQNKQYNRAIAAFRVSLEKTPDDVMTIYRLGEAYLGLGETQRARHHFVSALEKNPSFVPAIDRLESLMQH